MSIYRRLFLWFCAANLLTLAVSVVIAHAIFERQADRPPDVESLVVQTQAALARGQIPSFDTRDERRRSMLVRNGQPLSGEPLPRPVARNLDELTADSAEVRLPRNLWLVSRRLQSTAGETWLIVMQRSPRRAPWARWVAPAVQILLSILAIAGVGWVVARHLTLPLHRIQTVVRRVAAGDLSSRIGGELAAREDEHGRLARDFDRMAQQIETLVQSRDQLLHDVSHELRAPLSRLRFALELARDDGIGSTPASPASPASLDRADREITRIDALVGELLALARMDQSIDPEQLPSFDLHALAQDVIEAERPQAQHRRVQLGLSGPALQARCDADALRRALENLIRNAVRHSPPDAAVAITLESAAGEVLIRVSDRGPGVEAESLPRLFEPFFRGKSAAGSDGYGLGLAIVARVMRAHRGRAGARNRDGGGLEVTLAWPAGTQTPTRV